MKGHPIKSPRTEAVAYRIWGYAEPLGWNCTSAQIAEGIGEPIGAVRKVIGLKGWANRVRCNTRSNPVKPASGFDDVAAGVWV